MGEHLLRRRSAVNTVGLDGDEHTTTALQEETSIQSDDTGLVRLGDIGEDAVDHWDEHSVLQGMTGVLDNGDNVGAASCHVDQVTAGSVRELDGVDCTSGANNVGNVRNGSSRSGTEVQNLLSWAHVDRLETTEDTSSQLASEGIPHTIFDLGGGGVLVLVVAGCLDSDTLLAVDRLAGGQIAGRQKILFSTSRDEDTLVSVGVLVIV